MPKIAYVNVYTRDLPAAVHFFADQVGLDRISVDADHGYASFAAGAVQLGVAQVEEDQAALVGRHTGIGFGVDDLEAEYRRLCELGVAFESPPERFPWGGFMAVLRDPDGNLYYLDEVAAAHG